MKLTIESMEIWDVYKDVRDGCKGISERCISVEDNFNNIEDNFKKILSPLSPDKRNNETYEILDKLVLDLEDTGDFSEGMTSEINDSPLNFCYDPVEGHTGFPLSLQYALVDSAP